MDIKFTLIAQSYTSDAIGQKIPIETIRDVFGSTHPITRSEWNTAGQQGLKPELMVSMFTYDYYGEEIAKIGNQRYSIYRTYTRDDTIELYMEKKVGV